MPQLELTELELKVLWLIVDGHESKWRGRDLPLMYTENDLFLKVYRAYRALPPQAA